MKNYLLFAFIFIMFLVFSAFTVFAQDAQLGCANEGEEGDVHGKSCCSGLMSVPINNVPLPSGLCPSVLPSYGTQFYCIKCGDGICGEKENKCNCTVDCNDNGNILIQKCPDPPSFECEGGNVVIDETTDENGCPNLKCIKNLSDGQPAEIKITPGFASEIATEKIGDLEFDIQLKEIEQNDNLKFVYQTNEQEKEVKILGIFKVKIKVSVQVDALTGEVKIKMPWWSIFAW